MYSLILLILFVAIKLVSQVKLLAWLLSSKLKEVKQQTVWLPKILKNDTLCWVISIQNKEGIT